MATPYDYGEYDEEGDPGATAGIAGVLGAIPGLNIISPGIAAAMGNSDETGKRVQMVRNAKGLALPEFEGDYQEMGYSGDFNPEMFADPESAQFELMNESPEGRAHMLAALQRMSEEGSAAGQARRKADKYGAMNEASQLAKGREGAIQQAADRRGQGGGLANMVMRQQGAQQGANRAQAGQLSAEHMGALEQLANTESGFRSAATLRGQDMDKARTNTDIANRFNLFNTAARNQINAANTGMRNEAGMRNLDKRQGVMGVNTGIRNTGVDRKDSNKMRRFGAENTKLGAVNSALGGRAQQGGDSAQEGIAAGKVGFENFKDLMKMIAGGG